MMINGVSNVTQVNNVQNLRKTENTAKVTESSDTVTVSREAKEMGRLNYEAYKNGDRVIAVGGQCLSRGLTLENLVVTYFYRNSNVTVRICTVQSLLQWFRPQSVQKSA